jgi:hypothetical protein
MKGIEEEEEVKRLREEVQQFAREFSIPGWN